VLSADEHKGFLLIARHYLAALMPDYEFDQTKIVLKYDEKVSFSVTGNVPAILGWRAVFGKEMEEDKSILLPAIPDGSQGTVEHITVEGKQTKPPPRYTEGTLIADMKSIFKFVTDSGKKARLKETSGIGTEATRANILKTLHERKFITTEKKAVISTDHGRRLIATLEQHLPLLIDPGETAVWEDALESIISREKTTEQFISLLTEQVRSHIETLFAPSPDKASCGISYQGKEVLDGGNRWIFPGKKGWFGKELCKRPMSAEDYIKVFEANGQLAKFDNFIGKNGKKFSAWLKYNPEKIYNGKPDPGVDIIFKRL
jgi:DNA topoisomerase IA